MLDNALWNGKHTSRLLHEKSNDPIVLQETTLERDLGVNMSNTLKATQHCHLAANRAMSSLKSLRMTFSKLTLSNFTLLYTNYVRPHPDYCLSAVGPHMVQDFNTLEKVQRRATKLVSGLKRLPYQERLAKLKIPSMKKLAQRGDLIEAFKILTGKVAADPSHFFVMNHDGRTRGHQLKLRKRASKTHLRAFFFFANRVVTPWNELPEEVVLAIYTNSFKNKLDQYQATIPS